MIDVVFIVVLVIYILRTVENVMMRMQCLCVEFSQKSVSDGCSIILWQNKPKVMKNINKWGEEMSSIITCDDVKMARSSFLSYIALLIGGLWARVCSLLITLHSTFIFEIQVSHFSFNIPCRQGAVTGTAIASQVRVSSVIKDQEYRGRRELEYIQWRLPLLMLLIRLDICFLSISGTYRVFSPIHSGSLGLCR